MKRLFFFFFFFIGLNTCFAQVYKNEDVIKMANANFNDDLITTTLENAEELNLDLSIDGIISLKGNGINDILLTKLRELQNNFDASNQALAFVINGNDYKVTSDGIYVLDKGEITTLNSTSTTFTPPKGVIKYKVVKTLEGGNANYSFSSKAQFIFVFENAAKSLNNPNAQVTNDTPDSFSSFLVAALSGSSKSAISPNDFKLVNLKVKRNQRSYVAGSVNMLGQYDFSLDKKEVTSFKYEQLGPNTYLVTPTGIKPNSQYCFLYTSNMSGRSLLGGTLFGAGGNDNKVYDFGIQ